jgi:alkylhydroperoxidase/carboxymuconolactone decarboxylase family protein YurZ
VEHQELMVLAGGYDDGQAAKADFVRVSGLHFDGVLGRFEAAVFEKRPDGGARIIDTASAAGGAGADGGEVIDACLAALFPAGLVPEPHVTGELTGEGLEEWYGVDVKRLAGRLRPGQSGVVAVADTPSGLDVAMVLARAAVSAQHGVEPEAAARVRRRLAAERPATVETRAAGSRKERMMGRSMDESLTADVLSVLATGDGADIERLLKLQVRNVEESGLDPRSHALCRLGALIALDAPPASFAWQVGVALESGVTPGEIAGALVAVAPTVGMAKVVSCAPRIATVLGVELQVKEAAEAASR